MAYGFEIGGSESPTHNPRLTPEMNELLGLVMPITENPHMVNKFVSHYPGTRSQPPLESPVKLPTLNRPEDLFFMGPGVDNFLNNWSIYKAYEPVTRRGITQHEQIPATKQDVLEMLQRGYYFDKKRTGTHWEKPFAWRLLAIAPEPTADFVAQVSRLRADKNTRGKAKRLLSQQTVVMWNLVASGLVDKRELGTTDPDWFFYT